MRTSLSRRFLIGLGVTSLAFSLLASIAAFAVFKRELESRQIGFLAQYVRERTDNVDRRFSNLITLHRSAIQALGARLATMSPGEADRLIDKDTVRQADGTRRSRDSACSAISNDAPCASILSMSRSTASLSPTNFRNGLSESSESADG